MRRHIGLVLGCAVVMALAFAGVAMAQEGGAAPGQGGEAAAPAPERPAVAENVLVAAERNKLTTFLEAVKVAGLESMLKDPEGGKVTVFAPSNEAFAALGDEQLKALMANPEALKKILQNHIVPDMSLMWLAISEASPLTTAAKTQLVAKTETVEGQAPKVTVQGVDVLKKTRNITQKGILYIVDKVLEQGAAG